MEGNSSIMGLIHGHSSSLPLIAEALGVGAKRASSATKLWMSPGRGRRCAISNRFRPRDFTSLPHTPFAFPGTYTTSTLAAAVARDTPTYKWRKFSIGEAVSEQRTTPGSVRACTEL